MITVIFKSAEDEHSAYMYKIVGELNPAISYTYSMDTIVDVSSRPTREFHHRM